MTHSMERKNSIPAANILYICSAKYLEIEIRLYQTKSEHDKKFQVLLHIKNLYMNNDMICFICTNLQL